MCFASPSSMRMGWGVAVVLVITVLEGSAKSRMVWPRPEVLSVSAVPIDAASVSHALAFDDRWIDIKREPLESLRAGERVYLFREPPNPGTPSTADDPTR